jgi:hypothetical protein
LGGSVRQVGQQKEKHIKYQVKGEEIANQIAQEIDKEVEDSAVHCFVPSTICLCNLFL